MIDLTKERQLNLLKEISKCRSIDNNCDYLLEHSDCDDLIGYINYLQQENQKYKEVINKAIEHIQNNQYFNGDNMNCLHSEVLLEILKGDSNE